MKTCSNPGCTTIVHARGLCDTHYRARYRKATIVEDKHEPAEPPQQEKLASAVFAFLQSNKDKSITLELLSDRFDVSLGRVRAALATLAEQGRNVHIDGTYDTASVATDIPPVENTRIDVNNFHGDLITRGFTADNHLCSKYARMDVLNALFDIWQEQGVTTVLQAGNMIDGEARFNRFDLVTRPGLEAQAEYLVQEWPHRKGMTTEFVCGDDHEGWYVQREGINIVNFLQAAARSAGRSDMIFRSYMEHTYDFVGLGYSTSMSMQHAGGGSAYAISYTVQKIVESYQPNEKPSILLVGHFHKAEFSYPRAVLTVQAGCTQDQTPFLRKRRIEAMVGGWTLKFTVDCNGVVHGFAPQWHPFYDRDFYRRWSYHWKPKGTKVQCTSREQ